MGKSRAAVAALAVLGLVAAQAAAETFELPGFKYPCIYRERQRTSTGNTTTLGYEFQANGDYSRVVTYDANFQNVLAQQIVRPDVKDESGNVAVFAYQAGECSIVFVPLAETVRKPQTMVFSNKEEAKWDGRDVYKYYNDESYIVYADRSTNFVWGVQENATSATDNVTATVTEYRTDDLGDLSVYKLSKDDYPQCNNTGIYNEPSSDYVKCAACTARSALLLVAVALSFVLGRRA